MRVDRLVAVLLLLQARGRVTAAEVAAELEISERTARRDLDALGMAGLPVYSRPGRNGGWRLAGGGRTDLSGLTAAEARALFLVAGTSSATPEVKAALRKLVRALPAEFRGPAEAAATAVVVDPGWDRPTRQPRQPEHLDALQRAVVDGTQLRLGYVARDGVSTTRVVDPLGLATKGASWYLVANTDAGLRTFRIDRVAGLEPTGASVVRPDGFDLEAAWNLIATDIDQRRAPLRVRALAAPAALDLLRWKLGTRVSIGPARADGRVEVELRGHNAPAIAGEIAGLGGDVEVLEPPEVRVELAQIAAELVAHYGDEPPRR